MDPIAEVPLVAISKEKNTSEELANMMRGRKMVALAKFKRPNISAQNRSKRFSERDSIVTTVTEKRKEFSPKQRNIHKRVVREIERSLLVKTRSEPIGSGTFGNCFLVEYRGITAATVVSKGHTFLPLFGGLATYLRLTCDLAATYLLLTCDLLATYLRLTCYLLAT